MSGKVIKYNFPDKDKFFLEDSAMLTVGRGNQLRAPDLGSISFGSTD